MRDAPSESDAVFIWIRKTVDWGDERAFRAQLSPRFAPVVELWDDTFAMPFREFRREVRAIAVRNLARVRGAVVAGWSDIPEGALVLPVDDDDWFAPATAETLLRERRPGVDAFRWRAAAVEVPIHLGHQLHRWRRSWFPGTAPTHFCGTNNYAIAKSERVYLLLANHLMASRWYTLRSITPPHWIDGEWGVANRTLASKTSLVPRPGAPLSRRALRRRYRRYRRLYEATTGAPSWCATEVAEMQELMQALRPR